METQSKAFDIWLSRVKIALEIVAIPVVAYWAFTRFAAEEAPALEHRALIQGDLSWQNRSATDCIAQYRIKFENIGKSSIELTQAMLRGWLVAEPARAEDITYVDPLKIRKQKPLVEADLNPYIGQRYPPGVKDEVGVSFIVKRKPGQLIVFLVEGSSQTASGNKRDWFDHRWAYVCEEGPTSSKRK